MVSEKDLEKWKKEFNRLELFKPNQKMAKEFLDYAKNDLQDSKILYDKKRYINAIYHFQQAVEKAAKSYALMFGFLNVQELHKDIGHKTPKIIFKLLQTKEVQLMFDLQDIISPKKIERYDLKKLPKLINLLNKQSTKDNIRKFSKEMILNALSTFKEIDDIYMEIKKQFINVSKELKNKSISDSNIVVQTLQRLNISTNEELRKNIAESMLEINLEIFDYSSKLIRTFFLGYITLPAVNLRYPSPSNKTKNNTCKYIQVMTEVMGELLQELQNILY